jgi:hypothetical protein
VILSVRALSVRCLSVQKKLTKTLYCELHLGDLRVALDRADLWLRADFSAGTRKILMRPRLVVCLLWVAASSAAYEALPLRRAEVRRVRARPVCAAALTDAQLRAARRSMEEQLKDAPMSASRCERISTCYSMATGALAAMALVAASGVGQAAVFAATAAALQCELGPSARLDFQSSCAARDAAHRAVVDASPPMVLVDNFVHNVGPIDEERDRRKHAAIDRLAFVNSWSLRARMRMAGDAIGVWLMLRCSASLGAAAIFTCRASICGLGETGASDDGTIELVAVRPSTRRAICGAHAMLAIAAALGGIGWDAHVRLFGRRLYAWSLAAVLLVKRVLAFAPSNDGPATHGRAAVASDEVCVDVEE